MELASIIIFEEDAGVTMRGVGYATQLQALPKRSLRPIGAGAPFCNVSAGLASCATFCGFRFATANKLRLTDPLIVTR